MTTPTISIPLFGPPISSATKYLARTSASITPPAEESHLLRSIRIALRGSGTDLLSSVHSTFSISNVETWDEEELTWNAHTVIVSAGGVMRKKWNFEEEGQAIQWACIGWLEQNGSKNSMPSHSSAHYTSNPPPTPPPPSERPTFGPFAKARRNSKPEVEKESPVSAVFVFLRSIGKIFLKNGLEYTFSLPFIVRKAWPLSPHGVMIQRVLEPSELEEAEITGDAVLPTIFSVTSPFSEAGTVGLTTGIIGGFHKTPASLQDEDENSSKPLKSVAPTEMVIWASHRGPEADDDVLVTVDVEKRQLSVWRYVYIKPKDIPIPLGRTRARSRARKRLSMSGVGSRRTSAIFNDMVDRRDRLHPLSPNIRSREQSPNLEFPEFPDLPPLSALPGMAPSLSTTTTMASLVSGGSSQSSAQYKGRRDSLTRNDLSVTMDRMVLGRRLDADTTLTPIEHGRMKAAYWMEKLFSQEISDTE